MSEKWSKPMSKLPYRSAACARAGLCDEQRLKKHEHPLFHIVVRLSGQALVI